MESVELPKREWYHVSGSSLDVNIPSSHNASTSQAVSLLQCNREYVVHMFSGVPRVIMLDSGINSQEELNNGSKCSSKLSGLGMECFSLSKVSNNIVYIKGKELSIVNIQSDIVNTLVRGNTHWKSVIFSPLDDRCFVAWNKSSLCLWNRSSYEYHILQDSSITNKSKVSPPSNANLSDCVLINYPDDVKIVSCQFIGDLIVLFTSNGCFDMFSSNLSPGEYFRSIKSRQIVDSSSVLLDAVVYPNIKIKDSLKGNNMRAVLLFVNEDVYSVRIYNMSVDSNNNYGDSVLLQSINIHVKDEGKSNSNSPYNARIIGPNWGEYFAIQIFNQLIICSVGEELPIRSLFFFPSRLLETAAFRPPKNVTWLDTGKAKSSENLTKQQNIEIFVSNIFGGLESIILPPALEHDTAKNHHSSENISTTNDVFAVNLSHQKCSNSDSKDNVTDDYYSVLMNNSQKGEKGEFQLSSTPQNKLPSDRSNLLTSIFSTLNMEDKPAFSSNSQSKNTGASINVDGSNLKCQISDVITREFEKISINLTKEINDSVSSALGRLLKPIERDIQSIKSHLSGIEKSITGSYTDTTIIPKIESTINEFCLNTNERLTSMDTCLSRLVKETRNANEKIVKLNKQCESMNTNPIDDFTQVVADSFGTLTNAVTSIQATLNRLESQINNGAPPKTPTPSHLVASNTTQSIASQIEDAIKQKHYDRAFAIAISADQAALSQSDKRSASSRECFVLNLAYKFDPCVWLDDPLPISHPVILGVAKILSDALPNLIESLKDNNGFPQNSSIMDLKVRILWIKETIHCYEPFNDTLTPSDVVQILNEISESMSRCINIINSTNDMNKSMSYITPACFTDGSLTSDITSILRHIRRITRNITSGMK
ncbi:putative coiled coil protein [Cryptosporidium canis]|uniref:Coiled coil protein n=1 Tax=Cryptosporidium canis TaxID=195482 RepID=A0ABQ8PAH1_9CRYT|nr:putative coiled coil protein [Cryptosporidium canis]KAJ1614543.1 putative coiled coil protein [Cryptosporidium canis]